VALSDGLAGVSVGIEGSSQPVVGLCPRRLLRCTRGPFMVTSKDMSIASHLLPLFSSARALSAVLSCVLVATSMAQTAEATASKQRVVRSGVGPVVGVIDIGKALEQYPLFIQMRTDFDKRFEVFQEQLKESLRKLDELRGTVQVMAEGSRERAEAEFQLKMGLQTQDFQRKSLGERLSIEEFRMLLMAYEDLDYAVTKIAKSKGISLVMPKRDIIPSSQPISELPAMEVQDRLQAYQRRSVWFASEEIDLTGDVIKFMMVPLPDRNSPERARQKPLPKKGS
jgi:Skp family chaperone for outer membrane proteins